MQASPCKGVIGHGCSQFISLLQAGNEPDFLLLCRHRPAKKRSCNGEASPSPSLKCEIDGSTVDLMLSDSCSVTPEVHRFSKFVMRIDGSELDLMLGNSQGAYVQQVCNALLYQSIFAMVNEICLSHTNI